MTKGLWVPLNFRNEHYNDPCMGCLRDPCMGFLGDPCMGCLGDPCMGCWSSLQGIEWRFYHNVIQWFTRERRCGACKPAYSTLRSLIVRIPSSSWYRTKGDNHDYLRKKTFYICGSSPTPTRRLRREHLRLIADGHGCRSRLWL